MDKFSGGGAGEGANVASSIKVLAHLGNAALAHEIVSTSVSAEDVGTIKRVLSGIGDSAALARKIKSAVQQQGQSSQIIFATLKVLKASLEALGDGRFLLVPLGVCFPDQQNNPQEFDVMIIVQRERATYRLSVVNTSKGGGVGFHSVFPSVVPAKNRYRTGFELGNDLPSERVLDMTWWMWLLFLRCTCEEKNTAERFYEVLGWLRNEPFEVTVDQAERTETPENWDMRSIQRSASTYWKVVTESVFHLCRQAGVSPQALKTVFHALRVEMLRSVARDLLHVPSVSNTDRLAIALGLRQMSYSALKLHARAGGAEEVLGARLLAQTVRDAEDIEQILTKKQQDDEYPALQSVLNLEGGALAVVGQEDVFPFFCKQFIVEDDEKAGKGMENNMFAGMAADLMPELEERKAKTMEESVAACRR